MMALLVILYLAGFVLAVIAGASYKEDRSNSLGAALCALFFLGLAIFVKAPKIGYSHVPEEVSGWSEQLSGNKIYRLLWTKEVVLNQQHIAIVNNERAPKETSIINVKEIAIESGRCFTIIDGEPIRVVIPECE